MNPVFSTRRSLTDSPQLFSPIALSTLVDHISKIDLSANDSAFQSNYKNTSFTFDDKSKIGLIELRGAMLYKPSLLTKILGVNTFRQLVEDVDALIKMGAQKIALVIDSSGTEWYSCLETASLIRNKADRAGVKLYSYVDGVALSGALALASTSHKVITNPESNIGGIGVSVVLRNGNKAMQSAGIKDTYLFAGDSKIPFDASGEWRPEFLADLQEKVNDRYTTLTKFIANNRRLNVRDVRDTKAKTYLAREALKLHLVDSIHTREEFFKFLDSGVMPQKPSTVKAVIKPKSIITNLTPTKETAQTSNGVRQYLEKQYGNKKQ